MAAKVLSSELAAWADANPGWDADDRCLARAYPFASYADGVAFAMAVALHAERIDHHPELVVAWGRVRVVWSTHDAGGVSPLDLAAALVTDGLAARYGVALSAGSLGRPATAPAGHAPPEGRSA